MIFTNFFTPPNIKCASLYAELLPYTNNKTIYLNEKNYCIFAIFHSCLKECKNFVQKNRPLRGGPKPLFWAVVGGINQFFQITK